MIALSFPAVAQERVALVIGNGAYRSAIALPNPANDANDMATALRDMGFAVISATDVDKTAFDGKLREFAHALRGARTALFFYAGHGMQVAGKNYAIPVDARLESAADLTVETVDIDRVLAVMQADEHRVNLMFLDACRDNPLTRSFARALPQTRAMTVGSGLSAVDAGRGTLIAFATAPNKVAFDGQGQRNSLFTTALLRHIRTPGLDIAFVMRRVTADVETASHGAQVPWMHASLTTDVVLKKGDGAPAAAPAPNLAAASLTTPAMNPYPAPLPAGPNVPLPSNVVIDAAMLQLVERHPLLLDAPPIRLSSYTIDTVGDFVVNHVRTRTNSTDVRAVRQLRPGIVSVDSTMRSTTSHAGCNPPCRTRSQSTVVLGGYGFVSLGDSTDGTSIFSRSSSMKFSNTSKLIRIENIAGRIFPMKVGNRYQYELTYETTTKSTYSNSMDEYVLRYSCQVTKQYEAAAFHKDLTGSAFLSDCTMQTAYKINTAANSSSSSKELFFDALGAWLSIDPISPRERLVGKDHVYTLKSFIVAR